MTQEKLTLLSCIKTLKQQLISELENLEERVIALELSDNKPALIQPANSFGEWLTARELAKYFKVSSGTIYDWVKAGIIPKGTAFGIRQTRWKLSEVESCLEQRQKLCDEIEEKFSVATLRPLVKRRGRPSKIRRREEII